MHIFPALRSIFHVERVCVTMKWRKSHEARVKRLEIAYLTDSRRTQQWWALLPPVRPQKAASPRDPSVSLRLHSPAPDCSGTKRTEVALKSESSYILNIITHNEQFSLAYWGKNTILHLHLILRREKGSCNEAFPFLIKIKSCKIRLFEMVIEIQNY